MSVDFIFDYGTDLPQIDVYTWKENDDITMLHALAGFSILNELASLYIYYVLAVV